MYSSVPFPKRKVRHVGEVWDLTKDFSTPRRLPYFSVTPQKYSVEIYQVPFIPKFEVNKNLHFKNNVHIIYEWMFV